MSDNLQQYAIGFLIALIGSFGLTRFVGAHARRFGLVDPVDDRKIHTEPIPRLGGVALFCSVILAVAGIAANQRFQIFRIGSPVFALIAGGSGMFALGLYDDITPMRARYKLLVQVGIAVLVAILGVRFSNVVIPFLGTYALDPWFSVAFTVIWLVGISNAFNLIDGLDGLAGGVALFALVSLFVVAVLYGNFGAALYAVILAGATIGFLRYNFPPANIFLGDSGSLFLGSQLAGLGLICAQATPGTVALAIPVVTLGLPILDTALTIVRRFLRLHPIFSPDRGHIHHRLLGRGHSPRNVAFLLYVACGLFATAGAFLAYPADSVVLLVVMLSMLCLVGLALLIQRLGFIEFQELGRLARGSVAPRATIGRNVRFREATTRLAELDDVREIFKTLGSVFTEENIPRAEVRLQRWFLTRRPSVLSNDGREDEELAVWTLSRNSDDSESWWEIVLPLVGADERRMGSLVIWEEGQSYAASLSHLQVISEHLRIELQQKLQHLGWPGFEELANDAEHGVIQLERAVGGENTPVKGVAKSQEREQAGGTVRDILGTIRDKR